MPSDHISHLRQNLKALGKRFPLYMDYQSTTSADKRVITEMMPYFDEKYGNPSSESHAYGWEAGAAIDVARDSVAKLINAQSKAIVFTSSATEANNIAILGLVENYRKYNKSAKPHIITVSTEHKSVLEPLKYLERNNYADVTYLPVKSDGIIDLKQLEKSITDTTILITVMYVHNEIGVIQPVDKIGEICKNNNILFHSDIAQAFGKIPIDVQKSNISLASISGHKNYVPKGIGALFIREGVHLQPIMFGGGHEKSLRPSTLPTPLIVALGAISEIAKDEMNKDYKHIQGLYDRFLQSIKVHKDIPLNGSHTSRWPGNINISIRGKSTNQINSKLKDFAVSSGSACTTGDSTASYTLKALGVADSLIRNSVRIGIGKYTTYEEIEYLSEVIKSIIKN